MKVNYKAVVILTVIVVLILVGISWVGLEPALANVTKLIVAIIGALAVVFSTIITHAVNRVRELEFEQYKQRQANYAELLKQIEGFVRQRQNKADALDTAHLYSWVIGSQAVIKETQQFADNPSNGTLRALLVAMREDMGLPNVDKTIIPEVYGKREQPSLPDNGGQS